MLVYIVWKTYYNIASDHILGIYTDKNLAIKKYEEVTKKIGDNNEIIISTDGTLLNEFNTINKKNMTYCTKTEINDDIKNVYFIKIHESGGGGSYHKYSSIY